ncbi:MAG: carbohydrate kinase [Treponema sp.]|jgi:fructokinase|nr:carbohydrate kinase [Treponema sp.]
MKTTKKFDVVSLGELLIDFTQTGISPMGMRLFEQNPGGAAANVLCALAKLGKKTAFIGKVGQDIHGAFLRETLKDNGVDISGLVEDPSVFTTLAFVELAVSGERSFSFARKPGADTRLRPEELKRELLEEARVFHFGSLSLTDEPARSAVLEAIRIAKSAGAIISYDPNYRSSLWSDEKVAIETMYGVLCYADCVKLSEEEATYLTGEKNHEKAAEIIIDEGPSCVVVTLGSHGADAVTRKNNVYVPVMDVPVIDTTGAGDSFWGAFLCQLIETDTAPGELTKGQLLRAVRFANAAACCVVQKRGAIPAMPGPEEVARYLSLSKN